MNIATRLFLYTATLFLLNSLAFGYLSIQDERAHLLREVRMLAWPLARTLAATFKYYHMEEQEERLGEIIHAVVPHEKRLTGLTINIYDRQGRRIDLAFEHGSQPPPHAERRPAPLASLEAGEDIVRLGGQEYFSVVTPIMDSRGAAQGAVEVLLSLDGIGQTLRDQVRRLALFILLTALLLGLLLYLLSRWSITGPITRLREAARRLGRGDLGLRIDKSGVRELDDLIDEFNRMAHNIESATRRREQLFAEKIKLARSLRHKDKLASIGQLASGLAHEIGTPLNVISGRAERLLAKHGGDPALAENLRRILVQAERIAAIMRHMLAFARKPTAVFREVSLEKVIEEAFALCLVKQGAGRPTVRRRLDLQVATVYGDEDGLRQVFVNLIMNSLHAMRDGGGRTIAISSRTAGAADDEVEIEYADDGPGVPDELKDRIFDPFFTTKDVGEGTGLGLFIAANIVEEHHGRLELDHDFAQGARFRLFLRRRPPEAEGAEHDG